jgi:hypothetical protein
MQKLAARLEQIELDHDIKARWLDSSSEYKAALAMLRKDNMLRYEA